MFLKSILIFIFLISIVSKSLALSTSECNQGKAQTVIIFANGMFNDKLQAEESLDFLISKYSDKVKDFDLAYNVNENAITQALQVFRQKASASEKFLWSFFSDLDGPAWFSNFLKKMAANVSNRSYFLDKDLKKHIKIYKKYLDRGDSIVIVSHSQGNFYANRAYEFLMNSSNMYIDRVKIVSVANPDSAVSGDGDYSTLISDGVITPIPGSLPPNMKNLSSGLFDHAFIKHYMQGDSSGEEIDAMMLRALDEERYFESGYLHESLNPMDKWVGSLQNLKKPIRLTKVKCLAVSLFLKNADWFGVTCDKRDFKSMKSVVQSCFDDEWSNPNRDYFHCTLYGLRPIGTGSFVSSGVELNFFNGRHEECKWNLESLQEDLTQGVFNSALDFIADPKD